MRTKNGKKQKLYQSITVRATKTAKPPIDFPVHENATIGEMMELEKLLNKVYAPVVFDVDYHWENVDG